MEDISTENTIQKKSIKQRLVTIAHSRYGLVFLCFISFIESAFFPIPPDVMVVPMIVAKPSSWKKIGLLVGFFSFIGSYLGYFIGFALFESVGQVIVDIYNLQDEMVRIGVVFNSNAFWSLFVAAFTPLPYKVFTVAAGVFRIDLFVFTLASFFGRAFRYALVAYLSRIGGSMVVIDRLGRVNRTEWVLLFLLVVTLSLFFVV
ncbi:MAG: membrane protein YqaA with SNARE-associated domain [Planctomycetota bacterium]|jgi:membrane protein YqaA with SNARE-associated domain